MALPEYTPKGLNIETADFGEIVMACKNEYEPLIDEIIKARAKGDIERVRSLHDRRASIALFMVDLCELRPEDHAQSLFNELSSCFSWQKAFSAVVHKHEGFLYRVTIELDAYQSVELDYMTFQHIEQGRPSRNPCPLSETGFKSVQAYSVNVNDAGSYRDAISAYLDANTKTPTVDELQMALI